jgi:hypothetical protein
MGSISKFTWWTKTVGFQNATIWTRPIRGRTQKFPEFLKEIYLKYLYKFETLVPLEVLPRRLDAAIPAPLPILETLSKIFNGNAVNHSLAALDSISVEDFRQCFQHWERCWDCCIQLQGGVLRRALKFQTCTNTLNKFLLTIPWIFGSSHVLSSRQIHVSALYCHQQASHNRENKYRVTCGQPANDHTRPKHEADLN